MQNHDLHRSIHKYATPGENSSRAPQFSSLAADDKYNPANKQFVPEMRSIDIRWANFSTIFSMAIDNKKSIRKQNHFNLRSFRKWKSEQHMDSFVLAHEREPYRHGAQKIYTNTNLA